MTTDHHNDPQVVRQRARFLAATEDLDDTHAQTLAWREAGYSHNGIARKVDVTEATVAKRLDRITVKYGIRAVLSKQPEERGRTPLTPVTPEDIVAFPPETREEWRSLAAEHLDIAPDWFDDSESEPAPSIDLSSGYEGEADEAQRGLVE